MHSVLNFKILADGNFTKATSIMDSAINNKSFPVTIGNYIENDQKKLYKITNFVFLDALMGTIGVMVESVPASDYPATYS